MKLIQVLLLAGVAGLLIAYFRWFRNAVLDKLMVLLISMVTIFFVIFPEITNRIAAWVGVGRGVDLIFYAAIVVGVYILLLLYAKIRKLEEKLTMLAREISLLNVREQNKLK